MKNIKPSIITIIVCVFISGCGDDKNAKILECVERGVSYFKEIGSYPTLDAAPNTGRSAEDVAKERCEKTITAF